MRGISEGFSHNANPSPTRKRGPLAHPVIPSSRASQGLQDAGVRFVSCAKILDFSCHEKHEQKIFDVGRPLTPRWLGFSFRQQEMSEKQRKYVDVGERDVSELLGTECARLLTTPRRPAL